MRELLNTSSELLWQVREHMLRQISTQAKKPLKEDELPLRIVYFDVLSTVEDEAERTRIWELHSQVLRSLLPVLLASFSGHQARYEKSYYAEACAWISEHHLQVMQSVHPYSVYLPTAEEFLVNGKRYLHSLEKWHHHFCRFGLMLGFKYFQDQLGLQVGVLMGLMHTERGPGELFPCTAQTSRTGVFQLQ